MLDHDRGGGGATSAAATTTTTTATSAATATTSAATAVTTSSAAATTAAGTATATAGTTSLPRHLARGAIGFGLIGSAFALTPSAGPAALLLALPGAVALRGCPTCWAATLIETVSAGRLRRTCTDDGCALHKSPTSMTP